MKLADHSYYPNGLGAINENGIVPCGRCGYGPGVHATKAVPMNEQEKDVSHA